jgi:hypothetical protein
VRIDEGPVPYSEVVGELVEGAELLMGTPSSLDALCSLAVVVESVARWVVYKLAYDEITLADKS